MIKKQHSFLGLYWGHVFVKQNMEGSHQLDSFLVQRNQIPPLHWVQLTFIPRQIPFIGFEGGEGAIGQALLEIVIIM